MDPIDDINNYKWGIFYYNPSDARALVPKRVRMMGYQLNYAQPLSYVALVAFVVLIVFLTTLISRF